MEIINAKTITDEMEQHYGTTDPIEVGKGGGVLHAVFICGSRDKSIVTSSVERAPASHFPTIAVLLFFLSQGCQTDLRRHQRSSEEWDLVDWAVGVLWRGLRVHGRLLHAFAAHGLPQDGNTPRVHQCGVPHFFRGHHHDGGEQWRHHQRVPEGQHHEVRHY